MASTLAELKPVCQLYVDLFGDRTDASHPRFYGSRLTS